MTDSSAPCTCTNNSIPCPCCKGTGQRKLSPEYATTLKTLKDIGPASCGTVERQMKKLKLIGRRSSGTLVHKRMEWMAKHGLIRKLPAREISKAGTNYKASLFEAV